MADEYQTKFADIPLPTPESLLPQPLDPNDIPIISKFSESKNYLSKGPSNAKRAKCAPTKPVTASRVKPPPTLSQPTLTSSSTLPSPPVELPQQQKLNPRNLQIFVCFFELLGKNAFDLLNEKNPISIMEDKMGDIQLSGIVERQLFSTEEFLANIQNAAVLRQSATTQRNDSSSRSHAVCRVRVKNPLFPSSEDGLLMLVDLAGSERAADSKDHSSERLAETKEINTSLMDLKDCIRARAIASASPDKFVHVPYRSSKLTVLLKDAFELASTRSTQTVVIAHISPCAVDVAHSINTLRYAAPLKVSSGRPAIDPKNPATWSHEQAVAWIEKEGEGKVNATILCPYESGLQLCRIPEAEFMRRVMLNPGMTEKRAKKFYITLWEMIVDARTRKRQESKKKDIARQKEREKDWEDSGKMLIERSIAEGVKL